MAKKWYKIQAKEDSADVYIYDYIGAYGVEAAALTRDLALIKDKKNINLYINSPGGDVFEGMTIYNSLLQIKEKLTVHVMGLAAEKRIMYQGSMVMIHNPWGCACGNAKEMREMAEVLDKIGGQLVQMYSNVTGQSEEQVTEWLDAETWFNADEAVENGFATELSEKQAAASIKKTYASKYHNVPEDIVEDDTEPTIRTAEDALRDAGFSAVRAKAILAKGFSHREDGEPSPREEEPDYSAALDIVKHMQNSLEAN
jgi:ATP-dependent Clp endopeptidase proteolytic subunit ClpP